MRRIAAPRFRLHDKKTPAPLSTPGSPSAHRTPALVAPAQGSITLGSEEGVSSMQISVHLAVYVKLPVDAICLSELPAPKHPRVLRPNPCQKLRCNVSIGLIPNVGRSRKSGKQKAGYDTCQCSRPGSSARQHSYLTSTPPAESLMKTTVRPTTLRSVNPEWTRFPLQQVL